MDMFCSDKTGTLTQNITTIESEFPWCEASMQGLLSFALLASEQTQNAEDVIDTMLFRCKQEVQAAFNRHTPHLLKFRFVRWGYALSRSPPACIGCGGFSR